MTLILGKSQATAQQMASYLLSKNKNPKLSRSISVIEFCQLYLDIPAKEGVRGDLIFCQMLKETGNLKYGGDVKYTQNNFAGIGATGGVPGCSFTSIEIGILAHAQHAKSYATKSSLNELNVDPRRTQWFINVKGGTAPHMEDLGGTWAVPGYNTKKYKSLEEANKAKDSYGYQVLDILNDILKIKVKEDGNMVCKVAIDAGHGSNTAGKRTPDNHLEHWINVKSAYYCESICRNTAYQHSELVGMILMQQMILMWHYQQDRNKLRMRVVTILFLFMLMHINQYGTLQME